MKKGDKINCPSCHNQTIVKEKVEMDGWTVKDKIFVCALCDAKLGDMNDEESREQRNKKAVSGLAGLFGEELEDKPKLEEEDGDRHFCKYCEHYVRHAFVERCQLHKKEINSMYDCPDFVRRKDDDEEISKEKENNKNDDDGKKPIF